MANRCENFQCAFYRMNKKGKWCIWECLEDESNGCATKCDPENCRFKKENPCDVCKRNNCSKRIARIEARAQLVEATVEVAAEEPQTEEALPFDTDMVAPRKAIAYTDGSFNENIKKYGYGVVLMDEHGEQLWEYVGSGTNTDVANMRNIAGEILGACKAILEARANGFQELEIRYDYEGVEKWVTGEWNAKNQYTQKYRDFAKQHQKKGLQLTFTKIKSHSFEIGNERADHLAKFAVGLAS